MQKEVCQSNPCVRDLITRKKGAKNRMKCMSQNGVEWNKTDILDSDTIPMNE
jgi:hypothetical protein